MPEVISIIKFTDTLSKALVELRESKDRGVHIEYELLWRMPSEDFSEHEIAKTGEFDKIWKLYREKLDKVVNALEEWDNM